MKQITELTTRNMLAGPLKKRFLHFYHTPRLQQHSFITTQCTRSPSWRYNRIRPNLQFIPKYASKSGSSNNTSVMNESFIEFYIVIFPLIIFVLDLFNFMGTQLRIRGRETPLNLPISAFHSVQHSAECFKPVAILTITRMSWVAILFLYILPFSVINTLEV
jgi:hypothetical protein